MVYSSALSVIKRISKTRKGLEKARKVQKSFTIRLFSLEKRQLKSEVSGFYKIIRDFELLSRG